MTTIKDLMQTVRRHIPAFLRRDTTHEQKQQQVAAGTTSHG